VDEKALRGVYHVLGQAVRQFSNSATDGDCPAVDGGTDQIGTKCANPEQIARFPGQALAGKVHAFMWTFYPAGVQRWNRYFRTFGFR
jgi:hypothetical protein